MTILMILLALAPLIIQLIELLMKRKQAGKGLNESEKRKLNKILASLRQLDDLAVSMGCEERPKSGS